MVKVAYLGMRKQIVERSRRKVDMRGAISLDIPQNLQRIELRHYDMGGTLRTQCESQNPRSMREGSCVQANGILAVTAPVARGHLRHRAPCQIGDTNAFSGTRRA